MPQICVCHREEWREATARGRRLADVAPCTRAAGEGYYPHQLYAACDSAVMIAIALPVRQDLMIADRADTALESPCRPEKTSTDAPQVSVREGYGRPD